MEYSPLGLLLAFVAAEHVEPHQTEVNTSLLNGDFNEEIFVEQPEGYIDEKQHEFVCSLLKALYGLQQAPREWFANINSFLCDLGFQSYSYAPCFYVKRTKSSVL